MNVKLKNMYLFACKIKEVYYEMYKTGSIAAHLKDLLFLLKEENKIYQSLSINQLAEYINTIPNFGSNNISYIMLGDAPFDVLFRMINKFQYFLAGRCMYSEDPEMDIISYSTLMNARWVYLYNEILFDNLFYYYRFFINMNEEYGPYFYASLLLTAYNFASLENKLIQFYKNQEFHLTDTIMQYSGITNIQESLDQNFYKNLNAYFETFIHTDYNAMFREENEAIESTIYQILYLSLYSSISNSEKRNVLRNNYHPTNFLDLSLKHGQFLNDMQSYFAISEYEKQLKLK